MLRELTKRGAEGKGFAHGGHFHVEDFLLDVAGFALEEVFASMNTECMEPIMTAVIARFARVSSKTSRLLPIRPEQNRARRGVCFVASINGISGGTRFGGRR